MIEPITAATAFATIISLIGQYRSEQSGTEQRDFDDFQLWLENNHQNEVLESIK